MEYYKMLKEKYQRLVMSTILRVSIRIGENYESFSILRR